MIETMMHRWRLAVAILLLVGAAGCHQREEPTRTPKRYTVRIEGMVFQPASITVAPGDSVMWVNKDLVPHAAATADDEFDSKVIEFNQSFRHTFRAPGEFDYVCPFHPTMKGTVLVR